MAASMRPRSIDRGNNLNTGNAINAMMRFNEAPINRPGKCQAVDAYASGYLASMRPRSIDRGNARGRGAGAAGAGCFNEAPINRPGKCGRPPP